MALIDPSIPIRNRPIRNRLRIEWVLVTALCALSALAIGFFAPNNRTDLAIYDFGQRFRTIPISDKILLVRVDDASLSSIGQWPWPRSAHARMIDQLYDNGARAVGVDILFPEPTANDDVLAQAINRAKSATPNADQNKMLRNAMPVVLAMAYMVPGPDGQDNAPMPPVPALANAASATGHVMQLRDPDGILRRMALRFASEQTADSGTGLHLAEALYRSAMQGKASALYAASDEAYHDILIPFASESAAFPSVSYAALLSGDVPADFVKDKIIILGAAAPGLGDVHPVPNGQSASGKGTGYGMDIIAHSVNAMLVGASIREIRGGSNILLTILPIFILMSIIARMRPAFSLPMCVAMLGLILIVSVTALSRGTWFAPSGALIGTLAAYPLWSWRRLHAIDNYVGHELARFETSSTIDIPTTADRLLPDPAAYRVDQLRQAISEVEALRRFVTDALDQLPDPMLVTDQAGIVRLCNRAAHSIFAGEVNARHLQELVPDAATRNEFVLPDAQRIFDIRRAPLNDASGALRGDIWYLADITPERRAQEERENVLRFLSHDMRSPQASILALIDLEKPGAIDPELANTIRNHARQTISLADNFIHLARLQASGITREPVEISSILHEVSDDFYALAHARNMRITVQADSADDAGLWISGDDHALRRAIGNLISNAIKYGSDAGEIRAQAALQNGANIIISIIDEGPGIPVDRRDAIFAMFDQGISGSASTGAGLGLSYVKHVVDAHGGTISVTDAVPHGAHFAVMLPAIQPPGDTDLSS